MSAYADTDRLNFVGDLKKGRPTLGNLMRVSVYRLLLYSMKAVMIEDLGKQKTDELFYAAGKSAGQVIFRGILKDESKDFDLVETIRDMLLKCRIGIFEVKQYDEATKTFTFVVKEDLDCSGMPIDGETKCTFDEGLISGILTDYFKWNMKRRKSVAGPQERRVAYSVALLFPDLNFRSVYHLCKRAKKVKSHFTIRTILMPGS